MSICDTLPREPHRDRARLREELCLHHMPRDRAGGLRVARTRRPKKEDDLLDKAWGLELTSRLSCQARVKDKPVTIEIPKYTLNQVSESKK